LKKVKTLLLVFENDFEGLPMSVFRAAIIERVGRSHDVFHNHTEDGRSVYRYPLIQYKKIRNRYGIVCLAEGVDEVHWLFHKDLLQINILGKSVKLQLEEIHLYPQELKLSSHLHKYQIFRWQGLNELNYQVFRNTHSLVDRTKMLERILIGNILSFAKGVEWIIEAQIEVQIHEIQLIRPNQFKDIQVCAFDLQFSTNLILPNWIGLGKGVSKGFGTIIHT
jgi:hypothetical protein